MKMIRELQWIKMGILLITSVLVCLFFWGLFVYNFFNGPESIKKKKLTQIFNKGESPFDYLNSLENSKRHFSVHYQQNQWVIFFCAFFATAVTAVLAALYF